MSIDKEQIIINMIKSQQWECTKGALRAMVALQGSYPAGHSDSHWAELEKLTDAFIYNVEQDGLHE